MEYSKLDYFNMGYELGIWAAESKTAIDEMDTESKTDLDIDRWTNEAQAMRAEHRLNVSSWLLVVCNVIWAVAFVVCRFV